jgi:hypothetical protein
MSADQCEPTYEVKEVPFDKTQLSKCRFCNRSPEWHFHKWPFSKYWNGHLEHFCAFQEYYLHGASWAVVIDWNEKNKTA